MSKRPTDSPPKILSALLLIVWISQIRLRSAMSGEIEKTGWHVALERETRPGFGLNSLSDVYLSKLELAVAGKSALGINSHAK